MNADKAKGKELFPVLTVSILAGSFIRPFANDSYGYSAQSLLLGELILFPVLCVLLCFYGKRLPRRLCPQIFNRALAAVLLLSAAIELLHCQRFYAYVLESNLPLFWFLVLALGVAAYAQSMSEGTLGRTAQIVLFFGAVSAVILFAAVWDKMRIENLECLPLGRADVWQTLRMRAALYPEYLLLPILISKNRQTKMPRFSFAWLPGILFAVDFALVLIAELVLGTKRELHGQAAYTIARMGALSVFRRLDAVHISIWMMLFYLKIALYFWAAEKITEQTRTGKNKLTGFLIAMITVLILFACVWYYPQLQSVQQVFLGVLLLWAFIPGRRDSDAKTQ